MRIIKMLIALLVLPSSVFAQSLASQGTSPQAIDVFVQHVDREWPGEAHQQALTGESLNLLLNAVEVLAQRRNATSAEFARSLQQVRSETGKYGAGTPGDLSQSRQLRKTLRTTADVVRILAERTGVADSIEARLNALDRSARSLDDDQPLRRQPDVLERFFRHAAEILKAMDTR
jgi:hypothetical protein